MDRREKEVLALMRRRNGAVLKWLSLFLIFVFAIMATTNYFTAAAKHGPENVVGFLMATAGQSLFFVIIFLIILIFPRFSRRHATPMIAIISPVLLTAQGFMLYMSDAHPVMVTLVEYIGFGILLQLRVRGALLLFLSIYLIPVTFVALGVTLLSTFLVVTIGGPVIATMAVYLQNLLVKQSLTIKANNRDLARSNREISALKKEQDRILDTVKEGLFIIGADLRIGSQTSAALAEILELPAPAGRSFPQIVEAGHEPVAGEETARFLKLMFKPAIAVPSLNELNPLKEVAFAFEGGREKTLQFRFSRIMSEGKIIGVLAAVADVTARKELEARVAERELSEQRRMKLVFRLIQLETGMLSRFLSEVRSGLAGARRLIEQADETDFIDRTAELFRVVHAIKGNAAVLELEIFENPAHDFESAIEDLSERPASEQRARFHEHLKVLEERAMEVDELISRLGNFQNAMGGAHTPGDLLVQTVENLAERLRRELDRPVTLDTAAFDRSAIDETNGALLREILVQLVRNSIMHGLEEPGERTAAGKPPEGLLRLSSENGPDGLQIILRDDGRGLQLDRIRRKALEGGRWSAAELDGFSKGQIANLIFEPGFSTAETVNLHAGRGVGLDLVKSRLKTAGGSIGTHSRPGHYCEFRMNLPASPARGGCPSGNQAPIDNRSNSQARTPDL